MPPDVLVRLYEPAFDYFLPACGVVAAALVPLAVATRFGQDSHRLNDSIRTPLFVSVLVGALLVAGLTAALVAVAIIEPSRWSRVIMLLPLAWVLLLVSRVVFGATSLRERAEGAMKRLGEASTRAARYGIYEDQVVARHDRVRAELTYWLAPWLTWVIGAWAALTALGEPRSSVYLVVALVPYAPVLAQFAWRSSADVTRADPAIAVLRITMTVVSLFVSASFALVLATRASPWLGAAYGAFALVLIAVSCLRRGARRIPVMRVIQTGDTVAALRRARTEADALAQRLRQKRGTRMERIRRRIGRAFLPPPDRDKLESERLKF
jgi:hypothetical protein